MRKDQRQRVGPVCILRRLDSEGRGKEDVMLKREKYTEHLESLVDALWADNNLSEIALKEQSN